MHESDFTLNTKISLFARQCQVIGATTGYRSRKLFFPVGRIQNFPAVWSVDKETDFGRFLW